MGMLSHGNVVSGGGRGTVQDGYQSGGTSSYPVTGFPKSAYLGNNRRMVGGGKTSQPTSIAGLSNVPQYDPKQMLIVVAVLVAGGAFLWHLDNK